MQASFPAGCEGQVGGRLERRQHESVGRSPDVAADAGFRQQEQNNAFVLMQYFGYLRRDPRGCLTQT
jgi:hypothetical protein